MPSHQIKISLRKLCGKHGIAFLYAFGSRAEEIRSVVAGEEKIDSDCSSDIDIAVKMLVGVTLNIRQQVELAIDLEDIFDIDKVDLVILTEADPFLAANIIRGERIYCIDETLADEYDLYILRRAGDLAPFERQRIEAVLSH
jgi:predicted nucleotidyltransferase